jgi:autotransporter-associated beta strand protein
MNAGTVTIPTGSTLTISSGVTVDDQTSTTGSSISGAGTLDLDANATSPFAITLDASITTGLDLTVSAIVADGGIVQSGTGNLGLSGANTFDGAIEVSGGILWAESDDAFGSTVGGTTVDDGASVYFGMDGLSVAENFTISGVGSASADVLLASTGSATLTGSITMTDGSQIGAATGATLTVNGVIGDGGYDYELDIKNSRGEQHLWRDDGDRRRLRGSGQLERVWRSRRGRVRRH